MVSSSKHPNHDPSTPTRVVHSKITNYHLHGQKRLNVQDSPQTRDRNSNTFQALTEEEDALSQSDMMEEVSNTNKPDTDCHADKNVSLTTDSNQKSQDSTATQITLG
jgi:hypothetical protein